MAPPLPHTVECLVTPRSPLRLPRPNPDGTVVGDEGEIRRLIHLDGRPVVLTVARTSSTALRIGAAATTDQDARDGLVRARFWCGVDEDLADFLDRFAGDPQIGRSVRDAPWLRPYRRPLPFEVLLSAICEQLITDERARRIKIAITRSHGRRLGDLTDTPDAATIARLAPAQLERCGLAPSRAITLVTVARRIADGSIDLADTDRAGRSYRRLRAVPGIGSWTLDVLALHGHGDLDALPAGDHAYRMAVATLEGGRGKASEEAVRAFFVPYAPWRGLAGWHLLRTARHAALRHPAGRRPSAFPSRREE